MISILVISWSLAFGVDAYNDCLSAVERGYYQGPAQTSRCTNWFDMPYPMTVRCLKAGFAKAYTELTSAAACRAHCQVNINWGPWTDYDLAPELVAELSKWRETGCEANSF